MKKRNLLIEVIFLTMLVLMGSVVSTQAVAASTTQAPKRQIPTLFFHGFGGTVHSMDYLIDQAQRDGYATRTLTIVVNPKGKVKTYGT